MSVAIPIIRHKDAKSWPKHEKGAAVTYIDYADALKMHFKHREAFTATYCVPTVRRRLATTAPQEVEGGIKLQLLLLDLDAPGHSKTAEWAGMAKAKIMRLFHDHPGGYCAESKNGFRVYYVLKDPHVISDLNSIAEWTKYYKRNLAYIADRYGLEFDGSCCDWTRLQRLPHDTRDGQLQNLPTFGDHTGTIGWELPGDAPEVSSGQSELRKPTPRKYADPDVSKRTGGGLVPMSKKFIRAVIKAEPEFSSVREQLELVQDGLPWSSQGGRDNAARDMTWAIARRSTSLDPGTVAKFFRASISQYKADDPSFDLDIASMYSRACVKLDHQRSLALADTDEAMRSEGPQISSTSPEHVQHRQVNAALAHRDDLYSQNGTIVRISNGEIVPLAQNMLTPIISECVSYVGAKGKPVAVPRHVVQSVFSETERPGWKNLLGMRESAALRPDGTVQCTEGYDPMTEVYLVNPVGEFQTPEYQEAVITLAEPFQDFLFDEGGLAGCVACILTLVARDLLYDMSSAVPAFVFTAPDSGSGKTTLAEICQIIAGISSPETMAYVSQPGEMEKRMQAHIMGNKQVLYIDNWQTGMDIGGPALDSMITAKKYVQVRDFGQLRNQSRPWRSTILITGNQLDVRNDTTRRVVYISVQRQPDNYPFKIKNLRNHVLANRVVYLAAATKILAHHISRGHYERDEEETTEFPSFEMWLELVGAAVMRAGFGDPCGGRRVLDARNDDDDEMHFCVQQIADLWPDGEGYYSCPELLEIPDMVSSFEDLERCVMENMPTRRRHPELGAEMTPRTAARIIAKLENSKAWPDIGVFKSTRCTHVKRRIWKLVRSKKQLTREINREQDDE